MRFVIAFVIALFYSHVTYLKAQIGCNAVLNIEVKEKDDGDALPFCTIYNVTENKSYISNEKGKVIIKAACSTSLQLKIRYVGFKDTTLIILLNTNEQLQTIGLEHTELHLHDVEVIGERQEQLTIQSNEHIHEKELFQSSGKSLGKVLENVQGIVAATAGNGNSKPFLHGMDGYRVLILNNGIRQEGQQWGKDHAPEIDAYLAREVIVLKGAASIRYGSDALAGVVLINPEPIEHTPFRASILTSVQSNGGAYHLAGHLQQSFQIGQLPFAWRLQSAYKKSGTIRTPVRYLKNTGFEEIDGSFTLVTGNKLFSTELFASLFHSQLGLYAGAYISNKTDLSSFLNQGEPFAYDLSDFSYTIDRPRQAVNHFLLKNKWHIHTSHHSALDFIIGFQSNRRKEFDKFRPRSGQPEFDYGIKTVTADAIFNFNSNQRWSTSIGSNYVFQRNNYNGRFFIPAFYSQAIGVFAIEKWILKRMQIEAGLRYDYKQLMSQYYILQNYYEPVNQFNNLTYSLSAKYAIDSANTLIANAGVGWRAPSVTELYSRGIHHGSSTYEVGNPNLKSERVYSVNLEHKWQRKYFSTLLSAYVQYIPNYIYLAPDKVNSIEVTTSGAWLRYNYEQLDATINGIDGSFMLKPIKPITLSITGSLVEGRDLNANAYLINIPAARLKTELTYTINASGNWQHELRANIQHVWQQNRTDLNRELVAPPPSYLLIGAAYHVTKKMKKHQIDLSLIADNLTNVRYRDYLDRFRFYSDMPGRNITVNVKYGFN